MHHTYDPNLVHDDQTDIVNQLKNKHEMLKKTRERRTRSPHGSRQNSLRRRKISQRSGDYESSTDYESRPTSVMTEHAGRDNLAFINENDEVFENDGWNIQLEEMNTKNADQSKPRRKKASAEKPNGSVINYTDNNNLNQNNSSGHTFYHGNTVETNLNGSIPNQHITTTRRSDTPMSLRETPQVSIISGQRVTDSRQTARPPTLVNPQNILPVMRVSTNGHIIRPDVDSDFEEVTYL